MSAMHRRLGAGILYRLKPSKYARNSKKLMNMLEEKDSAWKFKNIQGQVRDTYFKVQQSWTDMDMEPARNYMSEKLFNSFQTKLSWMKFKSERNVLKRIHLREAVPVAVYDDKNDELDHVWFYISGRMVDYTINSESGDRLSGSTAPQSFGEYWQFVRRDNRRWVLNQILQKDEADKIAFCE